MKDDIVYDGKAQNDMSDAEKRLLELIAGAEPQMNLKFKWSKK